MSLFDLVALGDPAKLGQGVSSVRFVGRLFDLGQILSVHKTQFGQFRIPDEPQITLEVVAAGLDVADDWIVEQLQPDDVVVTTDIPLADRCLKKGASAIKPTGKVYREDSIGEAVATRDLLTELRSAGEITGGPPPLKKCDRSLFLQQLDNVIQAVRRKHKLA